MIIVECMENRKIFHFKISLMYIFRNDKPIYFWLLARMILDLCTVCFATIKEAQIMLGVFY